MSKSISVDIDEEYLQEQFEDLDGVGDWSGGAVLWSTDWTAETILTQLHKSNIDLDPDFQRRSAWTDVKQSLFIESIILGLPIPQLILAENPIKRGSFIVIDGKQRLLAIRRFCAAPDDGEFAQLKLKRLEKLPHLNGFTYHKMQQRFDFDEDKSAFENSTIRTIVIRNARSEQYLYEVFLRINTGSVQLSPQELRQALHPGPFSNFINEQSAGSPELRLALGLDRPDFRMRDAEILLRFISYKNFINEYNGNLKKFLDDVTCLINKKWSEYEINIKQQCKEMELALEFLRQIFGEYYLCKWNGKEFESRRNRAVFDIMLHYFSIEPVRHSLEGRGADVVKGFQRLCEVDEFRNALETTTKSMAANQCRFNKWGSELEQLTGLDLSAHKFPERKNAD